MELTVQGQKMDVGESLREHVEDRLDEINEKYFNHATYATVTFSKEGHGHPQTKAHIMVQLGKNIMVIADATDQDVYASFEAAAAKLAKQMRRYKRKIRDNHERQDVDPEYQEIKARDYVLAAAPEQDDEPENEVESTGSDAPAVIAEMDTSIRTLSVSDAVMHLDLTNSNALLFRNAKSGNLNMVYKRNDGNIGWVDPDKH